MAGAGMEGKLNGKHFGLVELWGTKSQSEDERTWSWSGERDHCKHFLIWDCPSESKRKGRCALYGKEVDSGRGGSERFFQTSKWEENQTSFLVEKHSF